MAWGNGGLFVQPWKSTLQRIANQTMDLDSDSFKVALYNNTPNGAGSPPAMFVVTLPNAVYLVGDWVTGNEVSGTGWSAGGQALTTPAVTESPSGTLMWTGGNISVAGTTLTNAFGCLIYDDSGTGVTAKYGICAVPFGSGYNTVAGTFGITWAAAGIFNIDVTP
jgi:hypothetical protein